MGATMEKFLVPITSELFGKAAVIDTEELNVASDPPFSSIVVNFSQPPAMLLQSI